MAIVNTTLTFIVTGSGLMAARVAMIETAGRPRPEYAVRPSKFYSTENG
jgi:hypothetical protein